MGREKSHWQKSLPHNGLFSCVSWWGEAAGEGVPGLVLKEQLRCCPKCGPQSRTGWFLPRLVGFSAQSSLTLCNPMDYRPPGSPVLGILQARRLEWVAMPSSRGSSQPGIEHWSPALQADSLHLSHQGSNWIARVSSCSIAPFPCKYHTDKSAGCLSCEDFNEVLNKQHWSSAGTGTQHVFLNLISCFTSY